MEKNNEWFKEQKIVINLKKKADLEKHKWKMTEFEYLRETDRIKHEQGLERQKIKSQGIMEAQIRAKQWS
jgi:hypothetical protein